MIEALQKRPFARPLLVWVAALVVQSCFPAGKYIVVCLFFPIVILTCSWYCAWRGRGEASFRFRWVWGAVFLSLLWMLAVCRTISIPLYKGTFPPKTEMLRAARFGQEKLLVSLQELRLSEEEKSVLATLAFGYKKAMKREIRERFSTAGVAHLLAVSGFHVAIVGAFVSLFFFFLPQLVPFQWLKCSITIGLVWAYVFMTGLGAPAVRAGLMLSFFLFGQLFRRITDPYNLLAASAFCMLLYDPAYLFDWGFQLSYIAVFFILYLQPRLYQLIAVRNPLLAIPWGWITVSVAAQIGTAFLGLYYFGQFSLVFLFVNVPLSGLATLLIPIVLLWSLYPADFPGNEILQYSVEILTRSLCRIVELFGTLPASSWTFRFSLPCMLLGYSVLLLLLLYIEKRRFFFLGVAVILVSLMPFV